MKSGYDVETYAEAFDAHNEFTGAIYPEGLAAEFRSICKDADDEIEALKDDALLIAKAAQRYVGQANAGDDHTCRWCGGTNCSHKSGCPIKGLIDITMIVAAKTDTDKEVARSALGDTFMPSTPPPLTFSEAKIARMHEAAGTAFIESGSVPEEEICCPYHECIHGMGVAGRGICDGDGNPRDTQCTALKPECPDCHGYGTADEEGIGPCPKCGGMGWIKKREE